MAAVAAAQQEAEGVKNALVQEHQQQVAELRAKVEQAEAAAKETQRVNIDLVAQAETSRCTATLLSVLW
jgi:hypothetical protein